MLVKSSRSMSASKWEWPLASADGLLTNEECSMLLDVDFFDDDLLKNFPNGGGATKPEPSLLRDEGSAGSLYPPSPPSPPEAKPSRAELAGDLLHQIETQCKQENIFPNWLEEKIELPIFENIPVAERVDGPAAAAAALAGGYGAPAHTEELLREFETVYGAVELTHLTPPHSPPGPATQLLLSYAQQAHYAPPAPPAPPAQPAPEPWLLPHIQPQPQPQPMYDSELQAVEELVLSRAALLASPTPSGSSGAWHSGSGSPRSSPPASPRSSTDEEWAAPRRARARPHAHAHARSPDDRRSRKKEQNKNAATRYRQKKKAEVEVLLSEEHALRQRHAELGDKCGDLQREIRYLKGLMRDLFKAKGLIK